MPENHNCAETEVPALIETRADEIRADALSLPACYYGHGGKAHDVEMRPAGERNRRTQHVADDGSVVLGDKGNDRMSLFAKSINEIGFRLCWEGRCMNCVHSLAIVLFLGSDPHALSQSVEHSG